MTRVHLRRLFTVVVTLLFLVTTGPAVASASAPPVASTDRVTAYLAAHPGGVRINANEISYGGGRFIVTVVGPAQTLASSDCPAGWFCFYEHTSYGYPRGKLSSCGWQDLAWWGWQDRVESAYYNLLNGATVFIHHTPGTSNSSDYRLFQIDVVNRGIPDVYPYRNMADYVYRYC
jgi:hypothetical protein